MNKLESVIDSGDCTIFEIEKMRNMTPKQYSISLYLALIKAN